MQQLTGPRDDQWADTIAALDAGDVFETSEETYEYFLGVLPPRRFTRSGFIFCEGDDFPTAFLVVRGRYFAQRFKQSNDVELEWRALGTSTAEMRLAIHRHFISESDAAKENAHAS